MFFKTNFKYEYEYMNFLSLQIFELAVDIFELNLIFTDWC